MPPPQKCLHRSEVPDYRLSDNRQQGDMTKAILTTKVSPTYDDLPEVRYHFPRIYLNQVQAAVGDSIIYYEPRRSTGELSSRGGRRCYFAVARVSEIVPDPAIQGHYYARITDYLEFDRAVPFSEDQRYYESALRKADGSTNKGMFGRAVRNLSDSEFDLILAAGFAPEFRASPWGEKLPRGPYPVGLAEDQALFDHGVPRPMIETTMSRPFRDEAFRRHVRAAYDNRCALSGLKLINGGGRPEVQAAHIRPVESDGPHSVRNGLALSGTLHWMFDRGLISLSDDYRILRAKNLPEDVGRLIVSSGQAHLPLDELARPHAAFLRFHREKVFKG